MGRGADLGTEPAGALREHVPGGGELSRRSDRALDRVDRALSQVAGRQAAEQHVRSGAGANAPPPWSPCASDPCVASLLGPWCIGRVGSAAPVLLDHVAACSQQADTT